MLASLRQTLTERLPSGLTEAADGRLQRTLKHYIGQVVRAHGTMNEQEILRETFDSMASWFRRNTGQLSPAFRKPSPPIIESAVAPDTGSAYAMVGGSGEAPLDGEQDPMVLFAQIRAARDRGDPFPATTATTSATAIAVPGRLPEPVETRKAAPMPMVPELKSIETRVKPRIADTPALQPKDFLQPQEDVIKYREAEYNLVLNSKDRNWLKNTKENRYNFSVMLDSASRPQGTGMQPTIQNRLRNIVRIEFVKALLPVEGLDTIMPRCYNTADRSCYSAPWNGFVSVLGMPSVTVVMDEEKDANTIGTNDTVNKSLAVCQYDATWRSDQLKSSKDMNRGYTLFFPKFMKAQRIYTPTPLANLQRMSFQLLNPEDQLLSTNPDSVSISQITIGGLIATAGLSCYEGDNKYLYIQTSEYFPMWSFSQTDRIKLGGLVFVDSDTPTQTAANSLISWLQRDEGHSIISIANGTPTTLADGANSCGYANYIIIQNRLDVDKKEGTCDPHLFTGGVLSEAELFEKFRDYPVGYEGAGVLNLSRQVQLVLRVITREYDPTTNLRPDNI
jgi:hypothetical protein